MVRSEDDRGVSGQRVEDRADVVVDERDRAVVAAPCALRLLRRETLIVELYSK